MDTNRSCSPTSSLLAFFVAFAMAACAGAGSDPRGDVDAGDTDADTNPPPCVPAQCQSIAGACGSIPDGCGMMLDCGTCEAGTSCAETGGRVRCTFTDARDQKTYGMVRIGSQIWMDRNLNYAAPDTYCQLGTVAPAPPTEVCEELLGRYYDWNAAMAGGASSTAIPSGVQGVCPAGWHLPSAAEYEVLANFIAAQNMLTVSAVGWPIAPLIKSTPLPMGLTWAAVDGVASPTDAYRFSLVPAGVRDAFQFAPIGTDAYLWTATEASSMQAEWFTVGSSESLQRLPNAKTYMTSVRCLRN